MIDLQLEIGFIDGESPLAGFIQDQNRQRLVVAGKALSFAC